MSLALNFFSKPPPFVARSTPLCSAPPSSLYTCPARGPVPSSLSARCHSSGSRSRFSILSSSNNVERCSACALRLRRMASSAWRHRLLPRSTLSRSARSMSSTDLTTRSPSFSSKTFTRRRGLSCGFAPAGT